MPKSDPERLAAALRENLRKRKAQGRMPPPIKSYGTDEEGDVAPPQDEKTHPGAWVDSKKGE